MWLVIVNYVTMKVYYLVLLLGLGVIYSLPVAHARSSNYFEIVNDVLQVRFTWLSCLTII